MEPLFWMSLLCLFHAYAGYGIIAWVRARLGRMGHRHPPAPLPGGEAPPSAVLVIPAFNEADVIGAKVREALSLDYAPGRLRVIVVTDGSDDGTADIVSRIPSVLHLHQPVRRGKAAAMNHALAHADEAEIVCFSDANTRVAPDALLRMVEWFRDPAVGAVAGEKRVRREEGSPVSGESAYWRYESLMKALDAGMHSAVGAAGELFCVRRALLEYIPEDTLLDDLHVSLNICLKGYRIAYEPGAVAEEPPSRSFQDELQRKARIAAGAFQSLVRFRSILVPWPRPVLTFQYVSRRLFRWVVCPLAIPVLFVANLLIAASGPVPYFYAATLGGQGLFHALAVIGWMRARKGLASPAFLHLPFYFDLMHACMWLGFHRYLRGSQPVAWHRARRR
jgi:biofilm PGA synthesis N-glycosyltransferase PgaC